MTKDPTTPTTAFPVAKNAQPNWSRGKRKYPWQEMEVGDHFHEPNRNVRQISSALHGALNFQKGMSGKKFRCETAYNEDGTKNGVRVFRIK